MIMQLIISTLFGIPIACSIETKTTAFFMAVVPELLKRWQSIETFSVLSPCDFDLLVKVNELIVVEFRDAQKLIIFEFAKF